MTRTIAIGVASGWVVAAWLSGCQVPSRRVQDPARDPARLGSASALEREARRSTVPETRAKLYLRAAERHLSTERGDDALRCIRRARESCSTGETGREIERITGLYYYSEGHLQLAQRYLQRGLPRDPGAVQEETRARLSCLARALGDHDEAHAWRETLSSPMSPRVDEILRRGVVARKTTQRERTTASRSPTTTGGRPAGSAAGTPSPSASDLRVGPVTILTRDRWQARPVRRNVVAMRAPTRITIHHSGPPKSVWTKDTYSTARIIQSIQRYHQNDRHWADIGYHFIIDRAGRVWQGRPLRYQGAHAGNRQRNDRNIGVVILGDYRRNHQKLTSAQRRGLVGFVDLLCRRYHIPPDGICTHGEIAHGETECPGPEISRLVRSIREQLGQRKLLATGRHDASSAHASPGHACSACSATSPGR